MIPEEEIRQTLADILSRPEYQESGASWFELLMRIIYDWVDKIFRYQGIVEPTVGQRNFASAVLVILFLILCGLIIYALTRIRKVIISRRRGLNEDIGLSPDEWDTRYGAAIAAGNYQEAFRCAWRYTVAWLNDHERLVERRGLTTGEAVAEANLQGDAFAAFTNRFDEAMYAKRHATAQDVAQAGQWREAIMREVVGK